MTIFERQRIMEALNTYPTSAKLSRDANGKLFDIVVVGGGINGTGIAADAAGRGLKVFLCEQNDLASGTSSASSKLIHGGLRYLEHYEFRLVKEALAEREVLLNKAAHLVSPLKFVMPHRPHLRPSWMIRCGLFLYDHLSKRNTLPKAKTVNFDHGSPFKPGIKKGFQYFDCWVDDARLVITNAIDARNRGASINTQTQCTKLSFDKELKLWHVELFNKVTNETYSVQAHNIVNASGPWLNKFLSDAVPSIKPHRRIRLIKGSHIIVPRAKDLDQAYILQNEDKRVVFVLPYLDKFSIIGTTDKEYEGKPEDVSIDDWEVNYLINVFNQHFNTAISHSDIVSTYSGVRPLCDDESSDPSAITRDYTLALHIQSEKNALISIYGGKITTYRKLAEAVMEKLAPFTPTASRAWTSSTPLPGSEKIGQSFNDIKTTIHHTHTWLTQSEVDRFAKSYGLLCLEFLKGKESHKDMGEYFGAELFAAEVDYLIRSEWATKVEDILWRRTKLGLVLTAEQQETLNQYIKSNTRHCIPQITKEALQSNKNAQLNIQSSKLIGA
jgi:glycerol-3-phosphate dehydrogenase